MSEEQDAELRREAQAWAERDAREAAEQRARMRRITRVLLLVFTPVPWLMTAALVYVLWFQPGEVDAVSPPASGGTAGAVAAHALVDEVGGRATALVALVVSLALSVLATLRARRAWKDAP